MSPRHRGAHFRTSMFLSVWKIVSRWEDRLLKDRRVKETGNRSWGLTYFSFFTNIFNNYNNNSVTILLARWSDFLFSGPAITKITLRRWGYSEWIRKEQMGPRNRLSHTICLQVPIFKLNHLSNHLHRALLVINVLYLPGRKFQESLQNLARSISKS